MDSFDDEADDDRDLEMPRVDIRRLQRPTVWPVFVTFLIVCVVAIALQLALVLAWVILQLLQGMNAQQLVQNLMDALTTTEGFTALAAVSQVCVVLGAFGGAWFFRPPLGVSLGLGRPTLAWWAHPIVVLGAFAPAALGAAMAVLLSEIIPADDMFDRICAKLGWIDGTLFTLFIALAPGFCEELFFRGYMQRRLLQAWRPAWAITVTALMFGILHMNPQQSLFAFLFGIWLGVIAWRTGSIWPGALCHAFWNGISVVATVVLSRLEMTEMILMLIASAIALPFFALSVWLLFRQPAPPILPADDPVPHHHAEGPDEEPGDTITRDEYEQGPGEI